MDVYPLDRFEQFRFTSTGLNLSGLDFGNADAPDLVMVHGIRDLAWSMAPLVAEFRDRFHVVVPDLRGHGDSDKSDAFTMNHFVADLRSLVLARGIESPVLIGHSLGGQIVTQYTAAYPEGVRALVLIDGLGPPRMGEGFGTPTIQQAARGSIETLLAMEYTRRVMSGIEEARERLQRGNPKLAPRTAEYLARLGTEPAVEGGVRWKWVPHASQVWNSVDNGMSELRWATVECPVLLITGDRSMEYWSRRNLSADDSHGLLEREAARRTAIFPDARHVMIEGAGHMVHYDEPAGLNREIRAFLEQL